VDTPPPPPDGDPERLPPSPLDAPQPPAQMPATGGLVASEVAVADSSGPSSPSYPATFEIAYPSDLNRWLPLVKWFLAIPHYVVLLFLDLGVLFGVIGAWFAILFTGRYPRAIFDFVVGVLRWTNRVSAYAFLLITDRYPPFRLTP